MLDGFVAQNNGSTGTLIPSEIESSLNFVSPGLLAMANAGPDTNDAQFFITAIDGAGTTDPSKLQLHIMDQIFGSDSDFDDLTVALSFSAKKTLMHSARHASVCIAAPLGV